MQLNEIRRIFGKGTIKAEGTLELIADTAHQILCYSSHGSFTDETLGQALEDLTDPDLLPEVIAKLCEQNMLKYDSGKYHTMPF